MSKSSNPAGAPLDPHARYVDQETGLEYENFAARFLGEPIDSRRNHAIVNLRAITVHPESVEAFWRAYDAAEGCEHTRAAAGYTVAANACHPDSFDAARFRNWAGHECARAAAAR